MADDGVFVCPQCGMGVAADEDGCCASCGATCCTDAVLAQVGASALREESPSLRLLRTVREGANRGTAHSWERLNHSMSLSLRLAIGSGIRWRPEDWNEISRRFGYGHWIGAEGPEPYYALAIQVGNASAVRSIETFLDRRPFIADHVMLGSARHGFLHGDHSERKRCRLAVGFRFSWDGVEVTVTSFASDQSYLTACSYRKDEDHDECPTCGVPRNWPRSAVDRRFRITRADLRAVHRASREGEPRS